MRERKPGVKHARALSTCHPELENDASSMASGMTRCVALESLLPRARGRRSRRPMRGLSLASSRSLASLEAAETRLAALAQRRLGVGDGRRTPPYPPERVGVLRRPPAPSSSPRAIAQFGRLRQAFNDSTSLEAAKETPHPPSAPSPRARGEGSRRLGSVSFHQQRQLFSALAHDSELRNAESFAYRFNPDTTDTR